MIDAQASASLLLDMAFAAYAAGEPERGSELAQSAAAKDPALKHSSAFVVPLRDFATQLLFSPAHCPLDALDFMDRFFARLPPALDSLAPFAASELSHCAVDVAFRAYALGQMSWVLQALRRALRYNPAWLLNRGVASLWIEAHLGQRVAATFRAGKPRSLLRQITLWRRQAMIDNYLLQHPIRKLQIGCGGFAISGWLNTDLSVLNRGGIVYVDATEKLPLEDSTIDFVFSEHLLEHLAYAEGRSFLAECWRVLKPGGVCRIATPRLELLIDLYTDPDGRYEAYSRRSFDRWIGGDVYSRALVINNFFHNWGHRCIYDHDTLVGVLERIGYAHMADCQVGESHYVELRGLERHGALIGADFNLLETMVLEARK